ncbi:hypothetical protein HAP48_0044845 [Bradyrhizobium septentrionale]|uniref:Uncharacterized protein n=1 Tax=Bradyrhizobium septentrionale TaxID=1404411 RepID=A0A973W3S9_9BRAD|nr:hypothetical protein [Bradyrhizobium septentrionale]UGY15569.1 hypothetical protein HAP48_0044845 [Bradyrhizobium septentrionale]UGY24149.1 hypothetical protein HU675_0040505 [Bradyrhizobium septentrionale]
MVTGPATALSNATAAAATAMVAPIVGGGSQGKLPHAALLRYEELQQLKREAHASYMLVMEELFELRQERTLLKQTIIQRKSVHGIEDGHPALATEANRMAAIDRRLPSLQKRHDNLQPVWAEIAGLTGAIDDWLRAAPAGLTVYNGPAPTLKAKETLPQAVERCRRRARELDADLQKYRAAPITSAKAKELIRAEIDRIAAAGEPDLTNLVDYGEGIHWPVQAIAGVGYKLSGKGSVGPHTAFDGLAVDIWRNRDAYIARLEQLFNEKYADDSSALDDADRARLISEAERDLLAAAYDEESFIRTSEEAGLAIQRRRDAPPAAVLGVEVEGAV